MQDQICRVWFIHFKRQLCLRLVTLTARHISGWFGGEGRIAWVWKEAEQKTDGPLFTVSPKGFQKLIDLGILERYDPSPLV